MEQRGLLSPNAAPETDGAAPEGFAQATPEEQAQYEQFVKNAWQLVYGGGKVKPEILTALDGDGDPKEGLAQTTVGIVARLKQSADESGAEISADVVLHAGIEILADLANLQKEAGIADLSDDEQEGAFYRAVDLYRDMLQKSGGLDTGALEEDFGALVEADRQGNPDAVLPGATEAAQRFSGKGEAPAEGDEEGGDA